MRHVMHKVILHFADTFLTYNKVDDNEGRNKQNDGKTHCGSHISCNATNITVLVGEMYDDSPHLSHWVTWNNWEE